MLKTSVVIATYNGEKFIEEQLDSILNQSYIPDEIIIFDDGSSDNTVNVINDYINKKNIGNICKLVKNEINKGYAKNFFDGMFLLIYGYSRPVPYLFIFSGKSVKHGRLSAVGIPCKCNSHFPTPS